MNTLNERGMDALQDFLKQYAKTPPTNSIQLYAWAEQAEQSDPPYLEIQARESMSGYPVTRSFSANEYFATPENYA